MLRSDRGLELNGTYVLSVQEKRILFESKNQMALSSQLDSDSWVVSGLAKTWSWS